MALSTLPDEDDEEEGAILSEINVTPLTDVFLVLLIIFMVATSAAVDEARQQADEREQAELVKQEGAQSDGAAGLEINLPRASTTAVLSSQAEVDIWVSKDGTIKVGEQSVDLAGLKQVLRTAGATDPDTLVVIRADTEISHGRVVSLMDLVRREGLTHLAVATVTAAAPPSP